MAPVSPSTTNPSLEQILLPPLWILVASSLPSTRTSLSLPLTLLTIFLALQPFLQSPQPITLTPVIRQVQTQHPITLTSEIRQVPPPQTSPLPAGLPPPSPTPSPISQPSPPPAQPQQPFPPFPQSNNDQLDLGQCSGGLKRMQVVLLLELCFEIMFLFLRCFAEQERDDIDAPVDVTMRGYVFLRAIYVVPVLAINAGIYWVGGGPTGSCLSTFSAVQVPFVHLIFYAIYCVVIVIIGVYRIDQYEKQSDYDTNYRSYEGSNSPPTRTTSYFRYGRRRRDDTSSSSYDEPKFRVNLGCCRLNF